MVRFEGTRLMPIWVSMIGTATKGEPVWVLWACEGSATLCLCLGSHSTPLVGPAAKNGEIEIFFENVPKIVQILQIKIS